MSRTRLHSAFTLIELLVVITIISIIISIVLPYLGGARQAAKELKALANGRTVGTAFEQYASQYKTYPFTDDKHLPEGFNRPPQPGIIFVKWYPEGSILGTSNFWQQESLWPALLSATAPWAENYATWVSPGLDTRLPTGDDVPDPDDIEPHVSWRYSNSFIARPRVWEADNPPAPDEFDQMYRGAAPADVVFPSNKVMLWDADLAYIVKEPRFDDDEHHYDYPTPMVFADAHADAVNPLKAVAGVRNALSGSTRRLHNTPEGIRGRDYID